MINKIEILIEFIIQDSRAESKLKINPAKSSSDAQLCLSFSATVS